MLKKYLHFVKCSHYNNSFDTKSRTKISSWRHSTPAKQKKKGVSACKSALDRPLATGKEEKARFTHSGSMKLVQTMNKQSTPPSLEIPLFAQHITTKTVKLIFHHRYSLHSTVCSQTKPKTWQKHLLSQTDLYYTTYCSKETCNLCYLLWQKLTYSLVSSSGLHQSQIYSTFDCLRPYKLL